jgi:hypothetical protein
MMHTYQASVRVRANNGRSQVVRTEVRATNSQDARWLLWAQYGFHSIQAARRSLQKLFKSLLSQQVVEVLGSKL